MSDHDIQYTVVPGLIVSRHIFVWKSDASGNAYIDFESHGVIDRIVTQPSPTVPPLTNYDVYLLQYRDTPEGGVCVLRNLLENRSASAEECVWPYYTVSTGVMRIAVHGRYRLYIKNAGVNRGGAVVFYVLPPREYESRPSPLPPMYAWAPAGHAVTWRLNFS